MPLIADLKAEIAKLESEAASTAHLLAYSQAKWERAEKRWLASEAELEILKAKMKQVLKEPAQ